jgi:hypothetical protein
MAEETYTYGKADYPFASASVARAQGLRVWRAEKIEVRAWQRSLGTR